MKNYQKISDVLASDGGIICKCVTHTLYHDGNFALYGKNKAVLVIDKHEPVFDNLYQEYGVCRECSSIIKINEKRLRGESVDVGAMVSPHLFPRLLPWQAMRNQKVQL